MKALNYIVCSAILLIGIVLLFSGDSLLIVGAFLWGGINYMASACNKRVQRTWRMFVKSNLEIERYFGV